MQSSIQNIEASLRKWSDVPTFLNLQSERLWRLERRTSVPAPPDDGAGSRLAFFRRESFAANQVTTELELIKFFLDRLDIRARVAEADGGTWSFEFETNLGEKAYVEGLGAAFEWLRHRSQKLRGVEPF